MSRFIRSIILVLAMLLASVPAHSAFDLPNGVKETTNSTGTGTISLDGAVAGSLAFSSQINNNDTVFYTIYNNSQFEIGEGTFLTGPNRIQRDVVLYSSNGNALVNFSAGSKTVVSALPAEAIKSLVDPSAAAGLVTRTTKNTYTARSIAVAGGLTVTNGNGVGGNPTIDATTLPCRGNTDTCYTVTDADADGDICDDMQIAANTLINPDRGDWGTYTEVFVAAPPSGTYDCTQQVRFCLSTAATAGSTVPSCNAADQTGLPTIHGVGDWDAVKIVPLPDGVNDPYPWLPNDSGPDALIWFGDFYNDEAGYVNINWPTLWIDDARESLLSGRPWNGIMPIFCDGCQGNIGWKSRTVSDGDGLTGAAVSYFVGKNLTVNFDLWRPGTQETPASGGLANMIGEDVRVGGRNNMGALRFNRDDAGSTSLFPTKTNGNLWGDTDAITFVGSYEVLPGTTVLGTGLMGALEGIDIQRLIARGQFEASSSTKPTFTFGYNSGIKGGVFDFEGIDIDSKSINMPIRFTGINVDPPIRIKASGLYRNTAEHDNGGIFGCLNMTNTPVKCVLNLVAASRYGKGQWISPPAARNDDTGLIFVEDPRKVRYVIHVPDGTAAAGKCILNPLTNNPTVGTCDATAEIAINEEIMLYESRLTLLEDSVASSSCLVAMQKTIAPGSSTWNNGPFVNLDCVGADNPHSCCTGAGAGNCRFGWGGHVELHYGEAASTLRSYSTDQKGEVYQVNSNGTAWAGDKIRFQFQQIKRCNGGSRANFDCVIDADCPSSTCGNIANSCGNTNEFLLEYTMAPREKEPQCYDGLDNDSDGLFDFNSTVGLGDAQCSGRMDNSE